MLITYSGFLFYVRPIVKNKYLFLVKNTECIKEKTAGKTAGGFHKQLLSVLF